MAVFIPPDASSSSTLGGPASSHTLHDTAGRSGSLIRTSIWIMALIPSQSSLSTTYEVLSKSPFLLDVIVQSQVPVVVPMCSRTDGDT